MSFDDCADVRVAAPDDRPEIMRLTRIACDEDGQHSYSAGKVSEFLDLHYGKRGGMIGVVGDVGTELKAYIFLVVTQVWFSDDWHVQELSLFVSPSHRKSTYARQLMAFSKHVAKSLDLDLTIGVLSNSRTEAKCRLYQRQFKSAGMFFIYKGGDAN